MANYVMVYMKLICTHLIKKNKKKTFLAIQNTVEYKTTFENIVSLI